MQFGAFEKFLNSIVDQVKLLYWDDLEQLNVMMDAFKFVW